MTEETPNLMTLLKEIQSNVKIELDEDVIDILNMPILEEEPNTSSASSQSPTPQNNLPELPISGGSLPEESSTSTKRRAFDVEFKLEAVKYAKETSKNAASRKFGVCRAMIQRWVLQEKELLSMRNNGKRLKGGGRHRSFPEMDNKLAEWVKREMALGKDISRRMIQTQAERLFYSSRDHRQKNFQASSGWLGKFLERHKIRTTWSQKPQVAATISHALLKFSRDTLKLEPKEEMIDEIQPQAQSFSQILEDLTRNAPKFDEEVEEEMPQIDFNLFNDNPDLSAESMTEDEMSLLNTDPTEFCNYVLKKFGDEE